MQVVGQHCSNSLTQGFAQTSKQLVVVVVVVFFWGGALFEGFQREFGGRLHLNQHWRSLSLIQSMFGAASLQFGTQQNHHVFVASDGDAGQG